jgi:hypothetical protein
VSDENDREEAITVVAERVTLAAIPVLSELEIGREVDRAKLARTWSSNTAYHLGEVVVLPVRNGHAYECVQPGTSGIEVFNYSDWPTRGGTIASEGNSSPRLQWEEIGSDVFNGDIAGQERNVYDINEAARECCLLRVRKSAELVQSGDVSFQQIYEHWKQQAETFRPFRRQIMLVRG